MKTIIKKEACINAAVNTISTVAGATHFVFQGLADITSELESRAICAVDKSANKKSVQFARVHLYRASKYGLRSKLRGMQEKYVKAKHNVERKVEDIIHGPLNDGPNPMPQMTAEEAFDLANNVQ